MHADWAVVVPLKPTARAKTRLGLSAEQRGVLARAFVLDLLAAILPVPVVDTVTVVSAPDDRDLLPSDVRWTPDPGTGLNDAIRHGAAATPPAGLVAVVLGDLPCARPDDVAVLLADAEQAIAGGAPAAFVADQSGVGTTALAARHQELQPRFGHRSRAEHRAAGAVELHDPRLARMRRDVDSRVDLADAVRLGVGPATRQAVHHLAG